MPVRIRRASPRPSRGDTILRVGAIFDFMARAESMTGEFPSGTQMQRYRQLGMSEVPYKIIQQHCAAICNQPVAILAGPIALIDFWIVPQIAAYGLDASRQFMSATSFFAFSATEVEGHLVHHINEVAHSRVCMADIRGAML